MNRELDEARAVVEGFREQVTCPFQSSNSGQAVYMYIIAIRLLLD
jgi:hypothetical protein